MRHWSPVSPLRLAALACVLFFSGVAAADTLLSDPLSGATSGAMNGGSFEGGGWKAPTQIVWDLGEKITEGTFSVQVTSWDPNDDSPQHHFDKQHIINMYEAPHGSPHSSDSDSPKTSFFNVRTGAGYDNLFKFLSSTGGFEERQETRVKEPYGFISKDKTYTIEVKWTKAGEITIFLDGQPLVTHSHGKAFALRYVFIGTDNAPSGTYGPQHDVIYSNVVVTATETGDVPDPPDPPVTDDGVFAPVADTWAEPLNPTATHGADPELRVGGDGRTIYLRFDVAGMGGVQSAKLYLEAMNGGIGGEIHLVPDNDWVEGAVTYQGRPGFSADVLSSLGAVDIGDTYVFDVSAAVPSDGTYSFAIVSSAEDGAGYWSREAASGQPRLEVVSSGEPVDPGDPPVGPADDSCEGRCGGAAPSGCGCHSPCLTIGNCCADACAACGLCPVVDPPKEDAGVGSTPDAGSPGEPDVTVAPVALDAGGVDAAAVDAGSSGGQAVEPVGGGFNADDVEAKPSASAAPEADGCGAAPHGLEPSMLLLVAVFLIARRRRLGPG